jgi:chromosome segregation ATPase
MADDADLDEVEARIVLIRKRLDNYRLGQSGKNLPVLDFESHVEEDLEWLLEIVGEGFDEETARCEKIEHGIEVIREEVLRLPDLADLTEKKLQDASLQISGLTTAMSAAEKALVGLRAEFDLYRAAPEAKLTVALRELEEVKRKLKQEEGAHAGTRNTLEFNKKAWEREKAKLLEEAKKLRDKLDGLPPTWQERVVLDAGDLPKWVTVGAKVMSTKNTVQGVITNVTLDGIHIKTEVIGDVLCPTDLFLSAWKVRP